MEFNYLERIQIAQKILVLHPITNKRNLKNDSTKEIFNR